MNKPNTSFLTVDLSEIWNTLKPIVDDFGGTISMSQLLKIALACWEYKFWAPDEYPNYVAEKADNFINQHGLVATSWLYELFFPDKDKLKAESYQRIYQHVMTSALSPDNKIIDEALVNFSKVLDTVVNLIDGVIVEDVKEHIYNTRATFHDCRFIIVAKSVTLFALIVQNRELPNTSKEVAIVDDYKNRQALKVPGKELEGFVKTLELSIKANKEKRLGKK
jgi:hypothetical protein